ERAIAPFHPMESFSLLLCLFLTFTRNPQGSFSQFQVHFFRLQARQINRHFKLILSLHQVSRWNKILSTPVPLPTPKEVLQHLVHFVLEPRKRPRQRFSPRNQ